MLLDDDHTQERLDRTEALGRRASLVGIGSGTLRARRITSISQPETGT